MAGDLHSIRAMAPLIENESNEPDGKFSNSFLIGFNGYVFILEFGMTDSKGSSRIHSRVVINPADAEEFSHLLGAAVNQHAKTYGPIRRENVLMAVPAFD